MQRSELHPPHGQRLDNVPSRFEACDAVSARTATEELNTIPAVLEAVPQALLLAGSHEEILFANRRVERLFGYKRFELNGRRCAVLIGATFQNSFARAHRRFVAKSGLGRACTDTEIHGRHKEGREFPLQIGFGVIHQTPPLSVVYFNDLTEREKRQAELRQSQKMEIIGMLTSSIAHDFNNLLTVINGFGEMLTQEFRGNDRTCSMVQQITEAGRRGASLIRQLMAFSRQHLVEPRVLDLNAVIGDTKKLLCRLIGEDIALAMNLEPTLGSIKADPGQVEQVILNLAVNARDAMPNGGKLSMDTANAELDDNYARDHPGVSPGSYVMLAVTDTGCGMDEETKARIFEPFFTTKQEGKGTGLGLATIDRIVKENGGHVVVQSALGRGATFQLLLPRVYESPPGAEPHAVCQPSRQGGETVLIVEDDDPVREVMRTVLQQHGYTVLEAQNPGRALELFDRNRPIHLLVTDVILPEMTGVDLSDILVSQMPGLRVLYVSGYPDGRSFHTQAGAKTTRMFLKPFSTTAFAQTVREVLDA